MSIDRDKGGNGRTDARGGMLGEIASEAGIERSTFLMDAGEQLTKFLDGEQGAHPRHRRHGADRRRPRLPRGRARRHVPLAQPLPGRDQSGQWVSETEVIDTAAELVELYNPADIYAAFAEAARAEAGLAEEPTGAEDLFEAAGVAPSRDRRDAGQPVCRGGRGLGRGPDRGAQRSAGGRAAPV